MSLIPIGTSDLRQIAGMLSSHDGMFSADDLVNYGKTVIVKPGAATEEGRVMTGADVQRLLGPTFSVFPMAVGYGPSVDQALSVFGNVVVEDDINELERDLDEMGGVFSQEETWGTYDEAGHPVVYTLQKNGNILIERSGEGDQTLQPGHSGYAALKMKIKSQLGVDEGLGADADILGDDGVGDDGLGADADILGEDSVGRRHTGPGLHRSVRLEAKYLKALAKFAKCQTLLDAGRGRLPVGKMLLNPLTPFTWVTHLSKNRRVQDRAKMCDRLHDRLRKIRTKMANKGIDVSRLPRIDDVRRSMVQEWHARQQPVRASSGPQVVYVERQTQAPGYQRPGYTPVSQEYLRDQAALEREMADQMPGYGADADGYGAGDQPMASSMDLLAMREYWDRIGEAVKEALDEDDEDPLAAADDLLRDLRAETTGWLGSSVEHDYFGVEGTEFEGRYGDDSDLTDGEAGGGEDGVGDDGVGGDSDLIGLTGGGRGRGSLPEDDEDLLTARMSVANAGEDDDILLGPDGGVDDATGAADEASATGADADADILGASDTDLATAAEGEETSVSDDALMDSDDLDVLGEDTVGDAGEATVGLRRVVTPDGRIVFSEVQLGEDELGEDETGAHRPLSKGRQIELARRRRHLRHAIRRAIRHGASDARVRALEHQLAMVHRQLRAASPTRGVDWSRVRPHRGPHRGGRRFGADAKDPVVVIAIRKRPTSGDVAAMGRDSTIREITASVGYNPSDTHILDVAAARLVAHGYTPVEAMSAMRQATIPGDWVRGSRVAFPAGDDAPMVGPRRVGREVIG